MIGHPMCSLRWLDEVLVANFELGLERSGRERGELRLPARRLLRDRRRRGGRVRGRAADDLLLRDRPHLRAAVGDARLRRRRRRPSATRSGAATSPRCPRPCPTRWSTPTAPPARSTRSAQRVEAVAERGDGVWLGPPTYFLPPEQIAAYQQRIVEPSRPARNARAAPRDPGGGMEISFDNLLIVVAAGFSAPLALGLVPGLRLPSVVLEIVIGIVIGPAVLGWVEIDEPVEVLALIGLAFLLFLAGLEIDLGALRGALLRAASAGFAVSLVLALIAGLALDFAGIGDEPLLIAVILASTSLGRDRSRAPGRGRVDHPLRPARDRGRLDRGLRLRAAAVVPLLGRVERRRHQAAPDRLLRARHRGRAVRRDGRRALPPDLQARSSACRTPAPRSGSAGPSCCWSAWRCSPSSSASS